MNQRKNPRLVKRNETIRDKFEHYTNKKHYNTDYALSLLEDEFPPLLANTIWLIVSQTGYYKHL